MKIRFIAFAAAALLASSAALAVTPTPAPTRPEPQVASHESTLVEELTRSAREILAAAVPEIALPKLELKLPARGGDAR